MSDADCVIVCVPVGAIGAATKATPSTPSLIPGKVTAGSGFGPACRADRMARAQLQAVESRIARLNSLKLELERMIEQCKGGRIAECRVIEVLTDHAECPPAWR